MAMGKGPSPVIISKLPGHPEKAQRTDIHGYVSKHTQGGQHKFGGFGSRYD